MRKFRPGFTLAEVLITLGIIGVVAAIVMPSVITSYQYKTIGVKLSKFASLVENATRPFVVQNDTFSTARPGLIEDFVNESFIITDVIGAVDGTDDEGNEALVPVQGTAMTLSDARWENIHQDSLISELTLEDDGTVDPANAVDPQVVKLKDGTFFTVSLVGDNATGQNGVLDGSDGADIAVDFTKVGEPAFVFDFDPRVTGLPAAVQKTYSFVVTELGYVYPNNRDNCLEAIYNADFSTNARFFRTNNDVCEIGGGNGNGN